MNIFLFLIFSGSSIVAIAPPPEPAPEPTVTELIQKYSDEYEVNFKMAIALAKFESKLNPRAKNPKSTAKGIYQFIDSTWESFCEGDVYNPEDNIKCAMKLISKGGISHWLADQYVRLYFWDMGFITCINYDKNWCKLK